MQFHRALELCLCACLVCTLSFELWKWPCVLCKHFYCVCEGSVCNISDGWPALHCCLSLSLSLSAVVGRFLSKCISWCCSWPCLLTPSLSHLITILTPTPHHHRAFYEQYHWPSQCPGTVYTMVLSHSPKCTSTVWCIHKMEKSWFDELQ